MYCSLQYVFASDKIIHLILISKKSIFRTDINILNNLFLILLLYLF